MQKGNWNHYIPRMFIKLLGYVLLVISIGNVFNYGLLLTKFIR